MRMMIQATFPVDVSNKAFRDKDLAPLMQKIMEDLKPEAAYFFPKDGRRSCMMVFDMKDTSEMPRITEAFFLGMEAHVELFPVMNAEDLAKGMPAALAADAARTAG